MITLNLSNSVYFRVIIACISIFLTPGNALAEDDYLRLLESEAIDLELDKAGQRAGDNKKQTKHYKKLKQQWYGECRPVNDLLPDNLLHEEFPSYLKQCSLSTYSFFRRLDTDQQHTVYEAYQRSSPIDFSSLRKLILQYL